ncbi:hypothetical protein IC611_12080 [Proteus mirabilis]
MVKDIAKSLDPGFRGIFSTIKAIVNSATLPRTIKTVALNDVKKRLNMIIICLINILLELTMVNLKVRLFIL